LASDGFLALASDYARYTPERLFDDGARAWLHPLGEELRATERAIPTALRIRGSSAATMHRAAAASCT
jgi:hypothetical protein